MLTPASKWRMNDSYSNDPHIAEQSGPPALHLHPADAKRLGIDEGVPVKVSNETGAIELIARIDDGILPGMVVSYKGRWPRLEGSRTNVNFVHKARMADMGGSTSVHSTEVNVRRA